MKLKSVRHKALKKFLTKGTEKGLDKRLIGRLRNMIAFISAAEVVEELNVPPNFGFHSLTGDRADEFAMTVTKNWRMTFRLNDDGEITDLNLEDYH